MEGYDLSSLKYATTAGEALNPEVYNRFYEYTGLKLYEGFGQTETTLTLANLAGTTPKPGSMGKPLSLIHIFVKHRPFLSQFQYFRKIPVLLPR